MPAARLVGVVVPVCGGGGGGEPPTSFARYARGGATACVPVSGAASSGDDWD